MDRHDRFPPARQDAIKWKGITGLHYDVVRCRNGYKAVQRRYKHGKAVIFTTFKDVPRKKDVTFTEKDLANPTLTGLARKYKVSPELIKRRLAELGVQPSRHYGKLITPEQLTEAMRTMTPTQYAEVRGVSRARIYHLITRHGIPRRVYRKRGNPLLMPGGSPLIEI